MKSYVVRVFESQVDRGCEGSEGCGSFFLCGLRDVYTNKIPECYRIQKELLDAAADENGHASIAGMGMRHETAKVKHVVVYRLLVVSEAQEV